MLRFALLLLVLGGCDSLFNLDRVPAGGGGSGDGDARNGDAKDDAVNADDDAKAACIPGNHDEDGDALMDGCDPCPTVTNTSTSNTDVDPLPIGCDPDLGVGMKDAILFYTGFAVQADLDDNFDKVGNVLYSAAGGGIVQITGGTMTMKVPFVPTKIEILTGGLTGIDTNSEAVITAPNAVCHVHHRTCGTTPMTTGTCVQLDGSNNANGSQIGSSSTGLSAVNLFKSSTMFCYIANNGSVSDQASAQFTSGKLAISTTASSTLSVKSIVIYGTP